MTSSVFKWTFRVQTKSGKKHKAEGFMNIEMALYIDSVPSISNNRTT